MKPTEKGTGPGSGIYFYTPSALGRKALYCPQAIGEFFCDTEYHLTRADYDSILLLYVAEGELILKTEGEPALKPGGESALKPGGEVLCGGAGELFVIDCMAPHEYYTESTARTLWVHFSGPAARDWCSEILREKGRKLVCGDEVREGFRRILELAAEDEAVMRAGLSRNEYAISAEIYRLICLLSAPDRLRTSRDDIEKTQAELDRERVVEQAKTYMGAHFSEELTVEAVASGVSMSASYFSRVFRETTGLSPYDYLLNIRLEEAKLLLRHTALPVSEVAYRCGFHSDANFIVFFRKKTGVSPLRFRNLRF